MKFRRVLIGALCLSVGMLSTSCGGSKQPRVTLEMKNGGKIVMELYPDKAPNTVKNFISLVKSGAYDGVIFHRVIPDFMIQGGDPTGTGRGGPGYTIKGEFPANGFTRNDLSHVRGAVSMARTMQSYDTAGCQFFICVADCSSLDGDYAVFGKVIEGMDTADEIVSVERDQNDRPYEDQTIEKATVDTFGVDYGQPEVIK